MTEEEKFWKGLKELKKQIIETDKRLSRQLEETDKRLSKHIEETGKHIKETGKHIKETDKKLGKRIEQVSDGYAIFVEGTAAPSAVKSFCELGYNVQTVFHRPEVKRNGETIAEYDTMLEANKDGTSFLILGEAKSFVTIKGINRFLRQTKELKKHSEKYKDYKIIGFVAGQSYAAHTKDFIIKNGLYLFRPSGDIMILEMPKKFRPKILQ